VSIYILAIVIGLFTGVLGALLGISGGIIMIPANQFILGFNPVIAIGTSLFAGIFSTLSGAFGHFRSGNIKVKRALTISTGGIIGVLLGSYVFKYYLADNVSILLLLMGLLFLAMAFRMGSEAYRQWHQNSEFDSPLPKRIKYEAIKLLILGLLTGSLAGILGISGGFILVPFLLWYFAAKPYEAAGTSLLAIFPYMALGGIIKLQQGFVNLPVGLLLALGAIIGAQFGVFVSRKINPLFFKLIFTLIFFSLAWKYILA